MTPAPLVATQDLAKSFRNGVAALSGINLAVNPGEFVGVLGPSGCGKSTLLRILAGLAEPSSGTVIRNAPRGGIGFVFQEPTLMPWASVWDNVYLPLRLRGETRQGAAPRISVMLDSLGLAGFERAYPRQLSGGMRMRVSIARALAPAPALLLLDEPFAALDEITRFKLNEELRDLWRTLRCTIVFVTHSVFESVFLTNRIVVMTRRPGRIVAELPVALPDSRDANLRLTPAYGDACRAVSGKLAEAMA